MREHRKNERELTMRPVISLGTQNPRKRNFYGARGRVGERGDSELQTVEKVKDTGAQMNTKQAKERLTGRMRLSEGD